jgi:glycosyltransferase involved in cell wall biosynthesis
MSVAKLSEQLASAGNKVTVYTTTANGTTELPVAHNVPVMIDGVEVTYFKRLTKDHSHLSPGLLHHLWKTAVQYDVIHIHAWWNLVSVLAAGIAVAKKVPFVLSPRGTLSNYSFHNKSQMAKRILHTLLGKRLLRQAYLHATSGAEQLDLLALVQPLGSFNIPNFVKIAPSSPVKKDTGPLFKLLFLSRIDEKKGLDILLNALPLLNTPYHLTIAGDGNETYIDTLKTIARHNLTANNISWIGFQDKTKFTVYAEHDLLVLPSHNENFGNVVIESLSAGTPVLVSKHVGLADYVVKNNLGWVCHTTRYFDSPVWQIG